VRRNKGSAIFLGESLAAVIINERREMRGGEKSRGRYFSVIAEFDK
jgi:ribosomal protein L14